MSVYNIEQLSYLIGYLRDITQNFGENEKSIKFYKSQVANLINIGQIGKQEWDIIDYLVAFSYINDSEKWKGEVEKVNQFVTLMNKMLFEANNDKQVMRYILENYIGKVNKKVISAVCMVFGIDLEENKNEQPIKSSNVTVGFGFSGFKYPDKQANNKNSTVNIKRLNQSDLEKIKKEFESASSIKEVEVEFNKYIYPILIDSSKSYYIRFKNLEACCTGDKTWYDYKLDSWIVLNNSGEVDAIGTIRKLSKYTEGHFGKDHCREGQIRVGTFHTDGDICHPSRIFNEKVEYSEVFRSFLNHCCKVMLY